MVSAERKIRAWVGRDDVHVRVARIIDPAAFRTGYAGCQGETPLPFSSAQLLAQSTALVKAGEVLRFLAVYDGDFVEDAIKGEVASWEDALGAGLPEEAVAAVRGKYGRL